MDQDENGTTNTDPGVDGSRRHFLDSAGRIALATPPAITLLLASGGSQPAWASGGHGGGSPGNSGNAPGHNK
jgi:hypothetical protein